MSMRRLIIYIMRFTIYMSGFKIDIRRFIIYMMRFTILHEVVNYLHEAVNYLHDAVYYFTGDWCAWNSLWPIYMGSIDMGFYNAVFKRNGYNGHGFSWGGV